MTLYSIRSDILSQWSDIEDRCDVVVFGGFGDSTGEGIKLNTTH